ncbi:MAG: ABC transporter substrate-binding protein [Candidatus Binatia bacterium]
MNRILSKSCSVLVSFIVLATLGLGHTVIAGELEEAAKKEGRLRLVAFPSFKGIAGAFQKRYGIQVEGTYFGAPPILRKVSQESDAGIFQIDAFSASPGPLGADLNKWMAKYEPKGSENVAKIKELLPKHWKSIPAFVHVVGVVYHDELVKGKDIPKSIYDLHNPKFKGKVISRTPWLGTNFFVHILSYYTWFKKDAEKWQNYWSKFNANIGRKTPKFTEMHNSVGLKEYSMGVYTLPYSPSTFGKSHGHHLQYTTFKEGGIWFPNMVAVHNKAPHPNAARLFAQFAISDEGQKYFQSINLVPANEKFGPSDLLKEAFTGVELWYKDVDGNPLVSTLVREMDKKSGKRKEWVNKIKKAYK